jgi:hypothetical protein
MNYLEKEIDYVPWVSTNRANTLINRWISGSNLYLRYQAFVRKNVQAFFLSLGTEIVENEQMTNRFARPIAIDIACQAQHPACLSQTTQRLQAMLDTGVAIKPDLVATIYCNGMRGASVETFSTFQRKMLNSTVQTERNAIITGLGCTQNSALLTNFFGFAVSTSSALSTAERSRILTSAINIGESSIRTMIEFLRTNYQAVNSYGLIATMSSNIAARISNSALLTEFSSVLQLLSANSVLTSDQANSYINSANTIINWQSANLGPIADFFETLDEVTTTAPTTIPPTTTNSPTTTQTGETTTLGAGNIVLSAAILTLSVVIKFIM